MTETSPASLKGDDPYPYYTGQGLRAPNQSWRERVASFLMNRGTPSLARENFVRGVFGTTGLDTPGIGLADLSPLGSLFDIQEDVRGGDYKSAAPKIIPGAALVKKGVQAGKKVAIDLARDFESRMARAKDGGFFLDMLLAHGTAPKKDFRAFNPERRGASTGTTTARLGVWSEILPKGAQEAPIADLFGRTSARATGGNPLTKPLLHRAERSGSLTLKGHETQNEIAATVAQAWDEGYDAIRIRNFSTGDGGRKGDILVVKNANQLRSPQALFDPKRRNSRDLLAGIAGATAVGGASLGSFVSSTHNSNRNTRHGNLIASRSADARCERSSRHA